MFPTTICVQYRREQLFGFLADNRGVNAPGDWLPLSAVLFMHRSTVYWTERIPRPPIRLAELLSGLSVAKSPCHAPIVPHSQQPHKAGARTTPNVVIEPQVPTSDLMPRGALRRLQSRPFRVEGERGIAKQERASHLRPGARPRLRCLTIATTSLQCPSRPESLKTDADSSIYILLQRRHLHIFSVLGGAAFTPMLQSALSPVHRKEIGPFNPPTSVSCPSLTSLIDKSCGLLSFLPDPPQVRSAGSIACRGLLS